METNHNHLSNELPGSDTQDLSSLPRERLIQLLAQSNRQLAAIQRINSALNSQVAVDDLGKSTLEEAIAVTESQQGSIQLYDAETRTLQFRHVADEGSRHLIGTKTSVDEGISGLVFRTGCTRLDADARENAHFNPEIDKKSGVESHSMLTVALRRPDGASLGVMQVLNSRRELTTADGAVLEVLCAQAAFAIEAARLAESQKRTSILTLLADISHQIKNLLTPVQTGIWTLQPQLASHYECVDQAACEARPAWFHPVLESSRELKEMADWILADALEACDRVQVLSKDLGDCIKGEMAPPVKELQSMENVVIDVVQILRPVAAARDVELYTALPHELPHAEFDRKQFFNALYNLVNNAIPETPPGGSVTVVLSVKHPFMVIKVMDTGRGIAPEVLAKLFSEEAISTKTLGTGLGTRVVAGVVARHNGIVTVESEMGKGTTFTIRLPLAATT